MTLTDRNPDMIATMIANLAAATMIHDDPDLTDYAALDDTMRTNLIIDYRDEFASSPFDTLGDAKIDEPMLDRIRTILDTLAS